MIARSVPVGIARGLHARPAESRRGHQGENAVAERFQAVAGAQLHAPSEVLPGPAGSTSARQSSSRPQPVRDKVGRGKPSSARQIWANVAALNAAHEDVAVELLRC